MRIAVANPLQIACTVSVAVNKRLYGAGQTWDEQKNVTTIPFVLPGGALGGSSVVKQFNLSTVSTVRLTGNPFDRGVIKKIRGGIFVNYGTSRETIERIEIADFRGRIIANVTKEAYRVQGFIPLSGIASQCIMVHVVAGGNIYNRMFIFSKNGE